MVSKETEIFAIGGVVTAVIIVLVFFAIQSYNAIECSQTQNALEQTRTNLTNVFNNAKQCGESITKINRYCKCDCDFPPEPTPIVAKTEKPKAEDKKK